jgi:hypothetical protein
MVSTMRRRVVFPTRPAIDATIRSVKQAYLVRCQVIEQVGIIGQRLDLDAGAVHVHSQQLRAVGRKGNLFNPVDLDEFQKVRITHFRWLTVRIGLNDGQVCGLGSDRRWQVHGHV